MGARKRAQDRLPQVVTEGAELFGFRLRHQLGRGAFASVYLAEQRDLACRPVVLKISATEGTEHQTLARLQHTNIVPIFSVHEDQGAGLRAVCMPYFGGATLASVLEHLWDGAARPTLGSQLVEALETVGSPAMPAEAGQAEGGERPGPPAHEPSPEAQTPLAIWRGTRLLQGGRVDRGPTGRGAPSCPSAGDPPPGYQAVEHPAQRRGTAAPAGFQRGPGDDLRHHPCHPRRHGGLRGPRTPRRPAAPHLGPDPQGGSAVGPVLARPGPGRDGDGRTPVRAGRELFGRHHPDRDHGRRADRAPLLAPGPSGYPLGPGEHRPQMPRPRPLATISAGRPSGRRPPPFPGRTPAEICPRIEPGGSGPEVLPPPPPTDDIGSHHRDGDGGPPGGRRGAGRRPIAPGRGRRAAGEGPGGGTEAGP